MRSFDKTLQDSVTRIADCHESRNRNGRIGDIPLTVPVLMAVVEHSAQLAEELEAISVGKRVEVLAILDNLLENKSISARTHEWLLDHVDVEIE